LPISFFKTHTLPAPILSLNWYLKAAEPRAVQYQQAPGKGGRSTGKFSSRLFAVLWSMGKIGAYLVYCLLTSSGSIHRWCMMVDELMKQSGHPLSGFYLDEHQKLAETLQQLENRAKDFADRGHFCPAGFCSGFSRSSFNILL
jgi:hypothetical protein